MSKDQEEYIKKMDNTIYFLEKLVRLKRALMGEEHNEYSEPIMRGVIKRFEKDWYIKTGERIDE